MKIVLNKIRLSNYKGIKSFETDFSPRMNDIIGENGVGKTTIFDAWLWLLMDRDSRGYKGSDACKTTEGAGFTHHLDHEVEAVILIDGKPVTLRKMLREKWTKPRGKQDEVYDGNVASYWIDDVPNPASLYKDYINNLVQENSMNILCDPMFFSTGLHWKDRLNILLDLVGGVSDAEVAEGDEDLIKLLTVKGDKSLDDYRKMIQEQSKRLNKDIDELPVRITEASRMIDTTTDWTTLEKEIAEKQETLKSITEQESDAVKALMPLSALYAEHKALTAKREALINGLVYAANSKRQELQQDVSMHEQEWKNADFALAGYRQQEKQIITQIAYTKESNDTLRDDVRKIDAEISSLKVAAFDEGMINPNLLICPTCHQDLPQGDINAKIEQMKANFESDIKRQLSALESKRESTVALGKSNAVRIQQLQSNLESVFQNIQEEEARYANEFDLFDTAKKALAAYVPVTAVDVANHPDVRAINAEIAAIQDKIDSFSVTDISDLLKEEKQTLQRELDSLRNRLYARGASQQAEERVRELKGMLKVKGAEKAILDGHLYQTDRFIVARTEKMESKINNLFTDVSFKLFSEQINGGITETCEPIVNGTTFAKANTGGQINAGLDIIQAISKHIGISVPVFVDHAESVTSMNVIDSQMIRLIAANGMPITVSKY